MKINSIQPVDVAIKVKKQSESGIYQNQRLLLMKSGYLSYFSKVPNLFDGNLRSLEHSGELPKMTLSARDVSYIKKEKKYLYLKFNKKHLINKKKLQKIINQDKRDGVGLTQNDQNIQWVFKCQTIDKAETFLQQILMYKKNPNLKPQLSKVVQGYREAKKGFRPQSLATSPSSNTLIASHRFSEQPQQIVKKFRTTSIDQMPFANNGQISNLKNQIKQQEIQEQNQIQPKKQQKIQNSAQKINIEHSEQVKQPTTALNISKEQQKPKISNTAKSIRLKEQPSNSYSKQTFPYFPFVKNKKSTKSQLQQLYHIQNSKSDKQLLKKLSQKQFKNKQQMSSKKQIKKNLDSFKNKRSATLGNKSLINKQQNQKRIQVLKRNSGQNGNPSWSQLKQLKRANSLFSSLKNQVQQNQTKQQETLPYQNNKIQSIYLQQDLQNKNTIFSKQPAQQQTCFILQQQVIQISNIVQDTNNKQNELERCQKQTNQIIQEQQQAHERKQQIEIQTKQVTQDKEIQNKRDSQKEIKFILQTETMIKQQKAQTLEERYSKLTVKIQPQIIQLDTQSNKQIKEQKIKNLPEQQKQQELQIEIQIKLEQQQIKQGQQIEQIKTQIVQNKLEEQITQKNNANKQNQKQSSNQALHGNTDKDIKQTQPKIKEQKTNQQIPTTHQQIRQIELVDNQIKTQVKEIVDNKIQQEIKEIETSTNNISQNHNKLIQSHVVNQPSQPLIQQSNKQLVQAYQLLFQQTPSRHQEQPKQNIIQQYQQQQQQQQLFKEQINRPRNKQKEVIILNLETVLQQQKESDNDDHVQNKVKQMPKSKKQKDTIKYFWDKPKQHQDHDQKQKLSNQRNIIAFKKKQSIQKSRELSHKREQQMKQKQIELQNIEVKNYAKQLLILKQTQQIGDTFRKIIRMRRKYTLCPQFIPEAIAKELLWIKKNNKIKKLAINLMIKQTNSNKLTKNIDCESIFFGPRQKAEGWQLFVYQQQAVYQNIFNFYCQLQKQIQDGAFNYGVRVAKFMGLMFRGYYGIFVQSVENSYKNIPNSITNIVNKVLEATFLTNMQVQIKIEVDAQTNQFIIWVNPSYLSQFNILTKQCNHNKNNDKIQSINRWVKKQQKETLFLIDQQIGQVSYNNNTIQILKQISNQTKLGIKYTTNTEIQVQTIFIIQQNNTIIKQDKSIISKLKCSIAQYLTRKQYEKAAQIIFWCGLKVLALSQLQNYISIYIIELLQVLKITIQLFIQEQKYAQAAEICRYNLQLLLGFSNIQQYHSEKQQNLIKIKLILILQNQQKILKLFEVVCSSMLYLMICYIKKQKSNQQNITNIFKQSLNIINCIQVWAINQFKNNQIVNKVFLDNHAYYCMLFNYFYASFCLESCSQILSNQAYAYKQASYKFAYMLLSSDDLPNNKLKSEHIETAQKIALNFIDFANHIRMYETANRTIENIFKLKITDLHSKFGRNLECRKSISLCFLDHTEISYQILLSHLLYCFENEKSNIRAYFSMIGSNNQLVIHQIIITYCKIFAFNDDKLFVCLYQILNNIADPQFYLSSLKEGLNELEPEVKKRVMKKLSL